MMKQTKFGSALHPGSRIVDQFGRSIGPIQNLDRQENETEYDNVFNFKLFLFKVLATCSFDRTAAVWEEVPSEPGNNPNVVAKAGNIGVSIL